MLVKTQVGAVDRSACCVCVCLLHVSLLKTQFCFHRSASVPMKRRLLEALGPDTGGGRGWVSIRNSAPRILPPGPADVDELFKWPLRVVQAIGADASPGYIGAEAIGEGEARLLRLYSNLSRGLHMDALYAGFDCPRWALSTAVEAAVDHYGWKFDTDGTPMLTFGSVCEWGSMQCTVLFGVSEQVDGGKGCIFGDILQRLPPTAQRMIESMIPDDACTTEQKKIAFEEIRVWLFENRKWVFTPGHTSQCMMHEQLCFCHGGFRSSGDDGSSSSGSSAKQRPWCFSTAGVTCVAWSTTGTQTGAAHGSDLYHHIWQTERISLAEYETEDVAFMECTPRYPAYERLGVQMAITHFALWVIVGSQFFAIPSLRERVLGAVLNRLTVQWVGPPTRESVEIEFNQMFARSMQITATALLVDSDDNRWEMYLRIANKRGEKRGRVFTMKQLKRLQPWQLLTFIQPPGACARLAEWYDYMEQHHPMQPGEAFFCDIDHHPGTRSTGGKEFPSQLTHGTVLAIFGREDWKMCTPKEHMAALGFHALPRHCHAFPECPVVSVLDRLNIEDADVKHLCGNGMHLQTQAAWMIYIISNIQSKQDQRECPDDDEWA